MTNDNILQFPGSKRPTSEELAGQRHHDREERKRGLSETLRQNQWLRGRADRIGVAQAVNDLLVRIEAEYGISPARVLGEVKPKKIAHRHKWDYAIPRKHRTPEEEEAIDKRLRKGTEPYVKIIDAMVTLVPKLHKDDLLFEVFGPPVGFRPGAAQEPEDEYDELAFRLRFVADAISEKYKLSEFFRDVERAGVSPTPASECVQRDAQDKILVGDEIAIEFSPLDDPNYFDLDGGTIDYFLGWPIELNQLTWPCDTEWRGDLLPYPSVVLGAWTLGDPFPVSLVDPMSRTKRRSKRSISTWGRPAVVLRFCIAPIGKDRLANPVLRIDLWANIDLHHWVPLKPGLVTVRPHEIKIGKIPSLVFPFSRADIDRYALYSTSPPTVLFLPIDGKVCKDWFSFRPSQNLYWVEEWPLRGRALGRSLCRPLAVAAPFSEYGTDTLAAVVENALCDPTDGLDQLLESQVRRFKGALKEAQRAARDLREKNWQVVEKRWERHEEL